MKVVHINNFDMIGGAAIAAYRHNCAMNISGFAESSMLVIDKRRNDDTVFGYVDNIWKRIQKSLYFKLAKKISTISIRNKETMFSCLRYGFDLSKSLQIQTADIVIIHWVDALATSLDGMEKIIKLGKPVYLFLHDQWYMTGGCHYTLECKEYVVSCEQCKKVRTVLGFNIAREQFRKKKIWHKYPNLSILAPSEWMCSCAKRSLILGGLPIYLCRNVIDTKTFRPLDKELCKKRMGISTNKKVIELTAATLSAPWKGFKYMIELFSLMPKEDYEFLIIGSNYAASNIAIPNNVKFTGYITDEKKLVQCYNSADVFVTPSLQDNFPNVIMEALACGTPCVGFNIGGVPELIKHKVNGYISNEISSEGLREGAIWCLDESNHNRISENARQNVLDNYSYGKAKSIYANIKMSL